MMKIEHIAIWVRDLEQMKEFYGKYFDASAGSPYENPKKQFMSYFLSFSMMTTDSMRESRSSESSLGLSHFAVSVGSKEAVEDLTDRLRLDGHQIASEPRMTGDGYYESVILDPEGNRVEITI